MKEKLWTKNYIVALLVMFGLYLVANTLLALMSIYAKKLTGVETYAGIMTSLFPIGSLAVRFLAGSFVDRLGSKKVILTGIGMMVIASLLFLNCHKIALTLFARGLQGVGFGLSATATSTFIASSCPPARLLEGISYTAVAQSLTAVIGPTIGFWIIGVRYDQFQTLFMAALVVLLITFLFMFFEKSAHGERHGTAVKLDNSPKVIWSILIVPVLILLANALTQSAIVSFLALYAISLNIVGVGSFFSVNALGMISSRFVMRRLVERFGGFQMILANTIVFAASVFLLTQINSLFQMLLIAFPAGFAMGSVAPIINTYLLQNMPTHKKGMANALYYSTLDIGFGVGSVSWGLVAVSLSYIHIFYFAAIVQVVGIIITFIHMRINMISQF